MQTDIELQEWLSRRAVVLEQAREQAAKVSEQDREVITDALARASAEARWISSYGVVNPLTHA